MFMAQTLPVNCAYHPGQGHRLNGLAQPPEVPLRVQPEDKNKIMAQVHILLFLDGH